jgi:tRNA (guanine37-N1)-methyltransferase
VQFDIVTIFPVMVEQALGCGVVGRAVERGTIALKVHDLRSFTTDRHRVVDDVPFGGGPGMVLKPEPVIRALSTIVGGRTPRPRVLLTSPQGTVLTHGVVRRLGESQGIVIVCGRYEGVDERIQPLIDEDVSIGDYVVSGGELPALVIVDAVARMVEGVVGDEQSVAEESFSRGLLDFPQYTRPARLAAGDLDAAAAASRTAVSGDVPEVLLSGHHGDIRRWRKTQAVQRTLLRRPDLLPTADLDEEEREILRGLEAQSERGASHGRH